MTATRYRIVTGELPGALDEVSGPFHAVFSDPPYGLGTRAPSLDDLLAYLQGGSVGHGGDFMGQDWELPGPAIWRAISALLHPGGHLVAFAGARTYDLMGLGIRAAGFELRDGMAMLYGSGMPKITNIGKALDRAAGAEREVVGVAVYGDGHVQRSVESIGYHGCDPAQDTRKITTPATDAARTWEGYSPLLKPAYEPLVIARKPFSGTVAQNCLETGCGALNIPGGRVGTGDDTSRPNNGTALGLINDDSWQPRAMMTGGDRGGRFPANVLLQHLPGCEPLGKRTVRNHSGSIDKAGPRDNQVYGKDERPRGDWTRYGGAEGVEQVTSWRCAKGCPGAELDRQSGRSASKASMRGKLHGSVYGGGKGASGPNSLRGHTDEGTASRFFHQADWSHEQQKQLDGAIPFQYVSKASGAERNAGCEGLRQGLPSFVTGTGFKLNGDGTERPTDRPKGNDHPCVKSIAFCRLVATLLLPPATYAPRRILVPYAGSGSEMIGCLLAGWEEVVGVERSAEYVAIAEARLRYWQERERGAGSKGRGAPRRASKARASEVTL